MIVHRQERSLAGGPSDGGAEMGRGTLHSVGQFRNHEMEVCGDRLKPSPIPTISHITNQCHHIFYCSVEHALESMFFLYSYWGVQT